MRCGNEERLIKSARYPQQLLDGRFQVLNRRLAAGALSVSFKKPWNYLAELPAEARREAPSEAANRLWWTQRELNPRPNV